MASSIAMDKICSKKIWLYHQLTTPNYAVLDSKTDLNKVVEQLGLPLIVKPPREGSTIGITKVRAAEEVEAAYALAAQFDEEVLAENLFKVAN